MFRHTWIMGLVLAAVPCVALATPAQEAPEFGLLRPAAEQDARAQALAWLRSVQTMDADVQSAFDAVWASDRTVLDKTADTFALGSPEAARLLAEVRDLDAAAPQHAPDLVTDPGQAPFFRANFALEYARLLSERRVHEQALETLKGVRPDATVDPATFYFVKAVAEHALMHKAEAMEALERLTSDVGRLPMRYKSVAALMAEEMENWTDDGLDPIAREAAAVKNRLDLGRGGEKTQELQKDIVKRLDDIIKDLEKPVDVVPGDPGQATAQPVRPAEDSTATPGVSGAGKVDMKKLQDLAGDWGKKSPKERAEAMQDMTRDLAPEVREQVERYFRELNDAQDDQ